MLQRLLCQIQLQDYLEQLINMVSVFDLFSIGVGPSSSHTVGPMKAACEFIKSLNKEKLLEVTRVQVLLYGSLALTGVGHGTHVAILSGLEGNMPDSVDPDTLTFRAQMIEDTKKKKREVEIGLDLAGAGSHWVVFNYQTDLCFQGKELLPKHTNGMRFIAFGAEGNELKNEVYYSIGGGFIVTDKEFGKPAADAAVVTYPFEDAEALFALCNKHHLTVAELMWSNEKSMHPVKDICAGQKPSEHQVAIRDKKLFADLLKIADIMKACIVKGCETHGILPGGLFVKRRAPDLYEKLLKKGKPVRKEFPDALLWPTVYAMAVNEENAAGGRIVTAPTNGAAGIIPAVLTYYRNFHQGGEDSQKVVNFLLTAGAIASLYKMKASISGAEVGCQGEVGVACSMAAGALAAVLGGTLGQIENAAEMAMEHHLGMTCDPVGGLVQIPCIERNGVGAEKAIKLAYLALMETGENKKVSLDKVIKTMKKTGDDMMSIYKETSLGGLALTLAVNVPEC